MTTNIDKRLQPEWIADQIDNQFKNNSFLNKSNEKAIEIRKILIDVENFLEDEDFMKAIMELNSEELTLESHYSNYLKFLEDIRVYLENDFLSDSKEEEKRVKDLLRRIYDSLKDIQFLKENFDSLKKANYYKREFISILKSNLVLEEGNVDVSDSFNMYWENKDKPEFNSMDFSLFLDSLIEEYGENINIELGLFLDMEDNKGSMEKTKSLIELAKEYKENLNIFVIGTVDEVQDIGFTKEETDFMESLYNFNFCSLDTLIEDFNDLDY